MKRSRTKRFRRRNYLVKKRLQSRFVLGFSATVFVGFLLNMTLAYFLIDRQLTEELYKIHLRVRTTSEIAGPVLITLAALTVPLIVVVAAIIGHYLTERIEAPLARLTEAVRDTAGGDFSRHIRSAALGELTSAYNKTTRSFEATFRSLRRSEALLEQKAGKLNAALGKKKPPSRTELLKTLDEISKVRKKAAKELARFNL